jgi:ribonuclease P/MRP protein subunit POP1
MASAENKVVGHKRKAVPTSSAARKRQKTHDIREISAQSSDAAVSTTGELDVASFVKAREYEISALEKSMQKSKKALTMRAFQQVPRAMRRRTASHNVKKVPRRLHRRAEKEVSDRKGHGMEPQFLWVIVADEGISVR